VPQDLADRFGEHIHKGDAVVMVHTSEDDATKAQDILNRSNPRPADDAAPAVVTKLG
jgi:hypothetical protein